MSDKDPHAVLEEWLLNMGYPKDKFPSDDQLKKVCRGSIIRYFWKDVVKNVKPRKEVGFIKENIFVKSVRQYERIENSSKAKLGQVLPPTPLLLWKQINESEMTLRKLRRQNESSENEVSEQLVKLKTKCANVNRMKQTISNVQREIHLIKETIQQLKDDVSQSKSLSNITTNIPCFKKHMKLKMQQSFELDVLADFLHSGSFNKQENLLDSQNHSVDNSKGELFISLNNTKGIDQYESLFSANLDEIDAVDVEKLLDGFDVANLYENLMKWINVIISKVLDDKNIAEEIGLVEGDARSRNVLPWKESLAQLNLMHCNLMIAGMQYKKNSKQTALLFQETLKSKILPAKANPQTLEILKIKCKYAELSAYVNAFKEFIDNLTSASGIFAGNIKEKDSINTDYGQSIVNLKDDILAIHAVHSTKQTLVHGNILKLSESIDLMKKIRKSVFDTLGHNDFGFTDRNESLNISIFHPNSTMKSVVNKNMKNLIDVKHVFCETNANRQTKQDIHDVSNLLVKELKSLKRFCLHRNRRIVSENGEKLWIDDTIQHQTMYYTEVKENLLKVMNPLKTLPSIVHSYEKQFAWKKCLTQLSSTIDESNITNHPLLKADFSTFEDENKDPKLDELLKYSKRCMKPLHIVDNTIADINKKLDFFRNFEPKKYIYPSRLVDGRNYLETEEEIKHILMEESYWK